MGTAVDTHRIKRTGARASNPAKAGTCRAGEMEPRLELALEDRVKTMFVNVISHFDVKHAKERKLRMNQKMPYICSGFVTLD